MAKKQSNQHSDHRPEDADLDRPAGQQSAQQSKMTADPNRDTPPAPVAGSKDDTQPHKSHPEKLHGPLSGEAERSGTDTSQ